MKNLINLFCSNNFILIACIYFTDLVQIFYLLTVFHVYKLYNNIKYVCYKSIQIKLNNNPLYIKLEVKYRNVDYIIISVWLTVFWA